MVIGSFIKLMGQMGANVEAEKLKDTRTQNVIKPVLENTALDVDETLVSKIKEKSKLSKFQTLEASDEL